MTVRPSSDSMAEALERALAFLRSGFTGVADAYRPIEAGVVLSTPSLPAVWSLNALRVSAALTFEAVLALADEQLAQFGYQHIVVEHQGVGPKLEEEFRGAGWKVERDLLMVLAGTPDRAADTSVVVVAAEDEMLDIMARWFGEDTQIGDDGIAQLVDSSRREARSHRDRLLGVRSGDGHLVAIAKLRGDGRTAQVEDVYTVPEARGRGYARAMVSRAVELAREAGHDLIFIPADDNDWPKLLYGRLGFRPLGHVWQFHRG